MFTITIKAEDYNEILRLGKIIDPRKDAYNHREMEFIAIYIDDPLLEAEALYCDNFLYGKFVFQVHAVTDTYSEAKPCVFMLPRQASEAAKPGTYVEITWSGAEEIPRELTNNPGYCTIKGTSKFGSRICPEFGVPVGYWPHRRFESWFEEEPEKADIVFSGEKLLKFTQFFPKKSTVKPAFRYLGLYGKVSQINNEWYCFVMGKKKKEGTL